MFHFRKFLKQWKYNYSKFVSCNPSSAWRDYHLIILIFKAVFLNTQLQQYNEMAKKSSWLTKFKENFSNSVNIQNRPRILLLWVGTFQVVHINQVYLTKTFTVSLTKLSSTFPQWLCDMNRQIGLIILKMISFVAITEMVELWVWNIYCRYVQYSSSLDTDSSWSNKNM